ncbi:hypothetical protein HKD37_18G051059 [Glycine soja]
MQISYISCPIFLDDRPSRRVDLLLSHKGGPLGTRASSFLLSVPGPPPDIGGRPTVRAHPEREAITHLLCIPGQDFTRVTAKRRMTLLLSNILASDHNANLPLQMYQLVWIAPTRRPVDPKKSNKALGFPALVTGLCQSYRVPVPQARSCHCDIGIAPTRHLVDPKKSNRALGFPALGSRPQNTQWTRRSPTRSWNCQALITGLCQFYRVPVAPSKVIRPPTNQAFIKKYCIPRQAQGETPQQPGDGRQRATDAPPSPLEFTSAHPQKEALGVAKPSVASYLSQEILAEQEVDRAHGLPAQPPVKFNNMVVISLSMKLKEEHCSIGFSRPLTNQNKNPFSFGSMEVYDYLVDTAAFVQTRESMNEFLTSVKQHDLAKAKVLSILNIGPAADFELYPVSSCGKSLASFPRVGGLRCYENPKNKITAVPSEEEEIWGVLFKNRESVISPNSNIRLMSVETALGTKGKCEVKDNRIEFIKSPHIQRNFTKRKVILELKKLELNIHYPSLKKRFYQVKVKSLGITSLKELGQLMGQLQRQAFRKAYSKIWDLAMVEVSKESIASLAQYYDQPLRCFTFGDFQLSPMVEEFEEILGCPLGGRKPYHFSGFYPSLARISKIVQISAQELDRQKQVENGVVGIPRKCLEAKARILAGRSEWTPFIDILALLIFGGVLFPNVDGLVDLAAIDAFLAYHNHKESPVVAMLADLYDTFDRRCEKSSTRIVWLVSHFFCQEVRHACPLEGHRSCIEKGGANWDQLLSNKERASFNWFPRWKEGRTGVLVSCRGFPNVPLMGTRGCISYNLVLAIRQLGYPMKGAPLEDELAPVISRGFNKTNMETLQKVRKAWEVLQKKDQGHPRARFGLAPEFESRKREEVEAPEEDEEVQALRTEFEQAQTVKERFKSAALKIRKENAELRDMNIATTKALEQETKRARREEHGRNKFRGALWGSNSEFKLRREERDQSRLDSLILKDELKVCSRSKRNLTQHLCETKTNMLSIVSKYQEELHLATTHENKVADEYAQVYAEKEARGRVIDSLHQEGTMWMDRFALTLNGSQALPRLLAKAKAMADTYSTPEEIHGLLSYCQVMSEVEEVQEQIKANMEAMKEKIATMREAMMSMKNIMEANAVTVAATRAVTKVNPMPPSDLNQMNHPTSDMVDKDLGSMDGPMMCKHAFPPYGSPPKEDVNNSAPILIESQQPQTDHAHTHEIPHHNLADFEPCLGYATEGQAVGGIPMPNTLEGPQYHPQPHLLHSTTSKNPHAMAEMGKWRDLAAQVFPFMTKKEIITMIVDILLKMVGYTPSSFADLVFAGEMIEVGLKRGKSDHHALINAKKTGASEEGENEGETHVVTVIPIQPSFPPTQQYHYSANNKPSPYPPPSYPQRPSLNQPQSLSTALPMTNTTFSTNQNTNQEMSFAAKKKPVEFTPIPKTIILRREK